MQRKMIFAMGLAAPSGVASPESHNSASSIETETETDELARKNERQVSPKRVAARPRPQRAKSMSTSGFVDEVFVEPSDRGTSVSTKRQPLTTIAANSSPDRKRGPGRPLKAPSDIILQEEDLFPSVSDF